MVERRYTIAGSGIKYSGGIYTASTMSEAAKTAGGWRLFAKAAAAGFSKKTSIKFILKETTRGVPTPKPTKAFVATRVLKDKPVVFMRAGKKIEAKYDYIIKPLSAIPDKLD